MSIKRSTAVVIPVAIATLFIGGFAHATPGQPVNGISFDPCGETPIAMTTYVGQASDIGLRELRTDGTISGTLTPPVHSNGGEVVTLNGPVLAPGESITLMATLEKNGKLVDMLVTDTVTANTAEQCVVLAEMLHARTAAN